MRVRIQHNTEALVKDNHAMNPAQVSGMPACLLQKLYLPLNSTRCCTPLKHLQGNLDQVNDGYYACIVLSLALCQEATTNYSIDEESLRPVQDWQTSEQQTTGNTTVLTEPIVYVTADVICRL